VFEADLHGGPCGDGVRQVNVRLYDRVCSASATVSVSSIHSGAGRPSTAAISAMSMCPAQVADGVRVPVRSGALR
jgi:hypothetical protein